MSILLDEALSYFDGYRVFQVFIYLLDVRTHTDNIKPQDFFFHFKVHSASWKDMFYLKTNKKNT